MDVFDLFAKISLDTSEYESGLSDAESKASSFGKSLGSGLSKMAKIGTVAIAGVTTAAAGVSSMFIKGAASVAEYGDNIDKMSQKLGLSAEAYQEWDAVMQHSGTTMNAMSRGMQTLQKNAVNSADKFEALGITQEQLAEMSTEELFEATITGLQNMEEGAERTALANELLGGSAKELGALLNTSAAETKAMRDRVHELGGVMSDEAVKSAAKYQDTLQDMKTAFSGLQRGIQSDFMPAITTVMEGLTELFSGGDGIGKINEGITTFINKMVGALPDVMDTGVKIVSALAGAIIDNIPQIISAGVKLLSGLVKGLIKNRRKIFDAVKQIIKAITDTLGQEFPALKSIMDKIQGVFDAVFGFILDNGPLIKSMLAGILAGFLAYKTAVVVLTSIQKAVGLVTTAVKLMNGEMALSATLNPFGAIAAAAGVAVGAVVMLAEKDQAALDARREAMAQISEESQQAMEFANQFSASLDNVYESNQRITQSVEDEFAPTEALVNELREMVDENGHVKEGYEERAQVITEQLAEAFNTEITYQNGVIEKYDEVMGKLDDVILKKKAEALLDANKEQYANAMRDQVALYGDMNTAQQEYNAAAEEYNQKLARMAEMRKEYESGAVQALDTFSMAAWTSEAQTLMAEVEGLLEKMAGLQEIVNGTSEAYYASQDFLNDYNNLTEVVATGTGDLQRAVTDMTNGIIESAPQDILIKQVEDAQAALSSMLELREKGGAVTDQQIADATERVKAAVEALQGFGKDGADGYAEGLKEDGEVVDAAEQMIKDAEEAVQNAQDSHSPSRLFKKQGVNAVEGYGKGIEDKQGWLKSVIESLMNDVKTKFTEKTPEAREWGIDLMKNFVDGIKSELPNLEATVKQVGQVIADNLEHSHPSEGPLADDYKWMPDMMELFADGIKDNAHLVSDAAVDAFDLRDAMQMPEMRGANGGGANLGRVVQLLQEIADNGMSVTLAGDADGIFTVVEQENRRRTKATRYNALSMMRS